MRKPGALPGATTLVQARKSGAFTAEHEAFWAAAHAAHGDTAGTRELIEVLLLHRHLAHPEVIAGLPPDRRPLPTVDAYDEPLTRRAATVSTTTRSSTANTSTGEVS